MTYKELPEYCPICKRKRVYVGQVTNRNKQAAYWAKDNGVWICAHCWSKKHNYRNLENGGKSNDNRS